MTTTSSGSLGGGVPKGLKPVVKRTEPKLPMQPKKSVPAKPKGYK